MVYDSCPCRDAGTDTACSETPSPCSRGHDPVLDRRALLATGSATLALLLLGRLPGGRASVALARALQKKFRPPAGARSVGNLRRLPADSALALTDPRTGQPAVVVRLSAQRAVKAYSAVCTHAGCTVRYDSGRKLLVCPCHGSVYDPARGAAVLSGPAPYPLTPLKVGIDQKGNIWLV